MIVVNSGTRQFNIPGADLVFGVESDSGSERKYFQCPRYVGNNLDVASSFVRINYRNANGETDSYLVNDIAVDGDNVTFSWELAPKVTAYKGQVKFVMCVVGPDLKVKWHTTLGTGQIHEGLEPDHSHVEDETADVVAQLVAMVEAQTAAVKTEGATQVKTVQTAASEAQRAAVAQIEAKGASTLATIPEAYTAVQNAARGAANAIRGKVSGEVIRVDDVSPMEHYPVVRVSGKNLFDVSKIPTTKTSTEYAYIREVGADYLIVTTPDGYTGNGYCTTVMTVGDVCPSLEVGKTYILTATTESNSTNVYLPNLQKSWIFGRPMVVTEQLLNSAMTFYGLSAREGMGTGDCRISNIQIEEGSAATGYTPYIDPTKVTVTRCSKNLISPPYAHSSGYTSNGVTFTVQDDFSVVINGTPTGTTEFLFERAMKLPVGTYTYRLFGVENAPEMCSGVVNQYDGETWRRGLGSDRGSGVAFEITDADAKYVVRTNVYILASGKTFTNFRVQPVLYVGNVATEYELYNGETQIPAADGTVSGLSAASPTMTLLTDTPGVNIECEYSRDTNKVINDILEKITAIGG